jgi:hypothetical protein
MGFTGQKLQPADSVSSVTNTGSVELGTRLWYDGVQYAYAYNAGTTSMEIGQVCHAVSNSSGYSVDNATTSLVNLPIGIVRNTTVSAAQYFWMCQRGYTFLYGSQTKITPGSLSRVATSGSICTYTIATAITNSRWMPNIFVVVSIESGNAAGGTTGWGYVSF